MRNAIWVIAGCLALAGCDGSKQDNAQRAPAASPADVNQERMLKADAEPGNWMGVGRTYDEQRFSPLRQINDGNVKDLGLAWYYDLKTHRGIEGTPLVIDGVMYAIGAWNVTVALDAKTGKELWVHDPKGDRGRGRAACCDVVSRGLSAWNGKILIATLDGRVIAIDAKTGQEVWSTQTFDKDWAYTITGAPRVFNGKVLVGNSGADFGVRGYVTAYDAETGAQLWRFYTVPGDPAKGFENKAMEMAASTWNGEWWKYGGGGTVWDAIVYDPALNLVYVGVGNGGPWVHEYRSPGGGDNLFLASIVALDADTGEYVWHYQQVPGEQWDYTATQPIILADLDIEGQKRKVLMQAPKNGFFYVIDRTNGQLISAEKFVPNTWASHIDMKTGRPAINPQAYYGVEPVLLTPSAAGAHNWNPMSYSPLTGLVYFPAQEAWIVFSRDPAFDGRKPRQFVNSSGWSGLMTEKGRALQKEGDAREKGWLTAWDPVKQKEAFRIPYPRAGNGGVLTTAGNLLVQGTASRTFAIYRADNGEKLWEKDVQTVPIAAPLAYTVDGEQYIAVAAGWGGGMAMMELSSGKGMHRSDARVLVFKLGGKAELPPLADAPPIPPPPPARNLSDEVVQRGGELYARTCSMCHGKDAVGGGVIKDLRHMAPGIHQIFKEIVLNGAMKQLGMGAFSDVLSEQDADAIQAYLISRANEDWGDSTRQTAVAPAEPAK